MAHNDYHLEHGMLSTVLALSLPETWFAYGERLIFAVVVALISTLCSKGASLAWRRIRGAKKEEK